MGFLDSVVSRAFRNEKAGRVVVFSGDRAHRGYLVRSAADELKIKSFLKMFLFAQFSIQTLGMFLTIAWMQNFTYEFGRPAVHIVKYVGIFLVIYALVVGVPFFFLWRAYKKSFRNFVSPQDEVQVSRRNPERQPWALYAMMLIALGILAAIAFFLIRAK
jgi:hypothetical protein